eukprot:scaffold468959_cov33-Prasinocladus_malaysianus.AAC.1
MASVQGSDHAPCWVDLALGGLHTGLAPAPLSARRIFTGKQWTKYAPWARLFLVLVCWVSIPPPRAQASLKQMWQQRSVCNKLELPTGKKDEVRRLWVLRFNAQHVVMDEKTENERKKRRRVEQSGME